MRLKSVVVVATGRVKVFQLTESGEEIVLAVRGPGALLGELSALTVLAEQLGPAWQSRAETPRRSRAWRRACAHGLRRTRRLNRRLPAPPGLRQHRLPRASPKATC